MRPVLCVPQPLLEPVRQLVAGEAIRLEVVAGTDGDVRVEQGPPKAQCGLAVLHTGGWIACPVAHATASKLDISNRAMGKILNLLDIKVRRCDLGCFE